MKIVAIAFQEFPPGAGDARWIVGVVLDAGDGVWAYCELLRELWIPCPAASVPESALATLHERLTQSRN